MRSKGKYAVKRHHSSLLIGQECEKPCRVLCQSMIGKQNEYNLNVSIDRNNKLCSNKSRNNMRLQQDRQYGKIEKFRKERIEKLYGKRNKDIRKQEESRWKQVLGLDNKQRQMQNVYDQQCERYNKVNEQDQKDMLIKQYSNIIKRLQNQNNNKDRLIRQLKKLQIQKQRQINTLNNHNRSINSTIQILKNQIYSANMSNQTMINQINNLKKDLQQQRLRVKDLQDQVYKKTNKLKQFEKQLQELSPRLKQLEDLQDKLITQNNHIKLKYQNITNAIYNLLIQKYTQSNITIPSNNIHINQFQTLQKIFTQLFSTH